MFCSLRGNRSADRRVINQWPNRSISLLTDSYRQTCSIVDRSSTIDWFPWQFWLGDNHLNRSNDNNELWRRDIFVLCWKLFEKLAKSIFLYDGHLTTSIVAPFFFQFSRLLQIEDVIGRSRWSICAEPISLPSSAGRKASSQRHTIVSENYARLPHTHAQ
jgi:hypothetical protein